MDSFVYTSLPMRVVFHAGARKGVADEVQRLGCRRALVICSAGRRSQAEETGEALGTSLAGIIDRAVIHTPVDVTEAALKGLQDLSADSLVAIGGGSAIGLAKALALRTALPLIALPTTYAGSEMTPVLGQTAAGRKTTLREMKVLPKTAVYDVELTLSLPLKVTAASAMNALAHAIEGLYAQERNPITQMQCVQAIEALTTALPIIMAQPEQRDARSAALFGACLAGIALGTVGMALHHKLCHILGGTFGLPHAETHAILLPHVAGFNAESGLLDVLADILGTAHPGQGLYDLASDIDAPLSLKTIGMPADGLGRAADLAVAESCWNPRPFTRDDVLALLKAAYAGARPKD